jgi:hypothetical protein
VERRRTAGTTAGRSRRARAEMPGMRRSAVVLACSSLLATSAVALAAPKAAKPPAFGKPVLLTTDKYTGGYEPSVTVDRWNNVYVTAHKQNHSLVLSPDSRSALGVRSQSWLWMSKDGKTFTDMPGLTPIQEQSMEFGDEGDVAHDDTGHMYFVDTNVVDDTFSRYRATGNGQVALEATRPVGPFGEPVDDRPWIAAHGDGVVMYIGNQGDKVTYPAGAGGDGEAYGPGRYTVYMSYDHGDTFDPLGITLNDSGWCRPAADHRKGSKDLYVLCTNDGGANDVNENAGDAAHQNGTLWAFASHDDGRTWTRSKMGSYDARDGISTYPSVTIGKEGTLYALYNHSKTVHSQILPGGVPDPATGIDDPVSSRLWLYTSKDKGRHWTGKDVTPRKGMIRYSWVDVAADGTLGIAYYYRETVRDDWYVWAATAKPGKPFAAAKVSERKIASKEYGSAFGDFFQIAFGPDNKLNVVWTLQNEDLGFEGLNTDIYYARQK